VKIEALFSDFDGTLCQLDARREDARMSPRLRRFMNKLSTKIPFGIITTKDLSFIRERVPFAHGIAAVSGLEMQVGERRLVDERIPSNLDAIEGAYKKAFSGLREIHDDGIGIERKTTEEDELIGFCIDWRMSQNWTEARTKVAPLLEQCRQAALYVTESKMSPFANVYFTKVDKSAAFARLKAELGVTGSVMYLGDSEDDNPAFEMAEVSIGIKHQKTVPDLKCKYLLEFLKLEGFIAILTDENFEFRESLPGINLRLKP
jgi:HAD superfamily hydrolase (TIGR01484 family)